MRQLVVLLVLTGHGTTALQMIHSLVHSHCAPNHACPCARRVDAPRMAQIEPTEECAEAQRAAYFEMMPSRKLPTVSLDLRAFASTKDDAFEAGVFARQEGRVDSWTNIGSIATVDPGCFTDAVAKLQPLICRWAYEVCNDFETNELLLDLDAPIELSWAVKPPKPSFWEALQGKKEDAPVFTPVPEQAAFDEDLSCGFLGVLAREYRGGGVSARYERIVIGKPPEMPRRDPSQDKYNAKYAYYKKSKRSQNKGQIIV